MTLNILGTMGDKMQTFFREVGQFFSNIFNNAYEFLNQYMSKETIIIIGIVIAITIVIFLISRIGKK